MSKRKRKKPIKRPWVQRRWSLKATTSGAGPSPEVMAEYQARARSMQYEWAQLDQLFPCHYPDNVKVKNPDGSIEVSPVLKAGLSHEGRAAAQKSLAELRGAAEPEHNFLVLQDRIQTLRLYFTISKTEYYFLRHRRISDTFEKSITYGNKARAMRALEEGRVIFLPPSPG